jgi:hypothetical protein
VHAVSVARSVYERLRRPAITVAHRYDFGADAALVGDDLDRPEAWDVLCTRTTGPFALPATEADLRKTADWRAVLDGFANDRILPVAAELVGPRELALQMLPPRRPERRARAGLLRAEPAFESLSATHRAQIIDASDLRVWALEPRR